MSSRRSAADPEWDDAVRQDVAVGARAPAPYRRSMAAQITVVEEPGPEHRAAIAAPLVLHNQRSGPSPNTRTVAILLKDDDGAVAGGLWGKIAYDWLFVELLAVAEHMRGRDYGAALMSQAESLARDNGCLGVWLDTFAFQSRGFYERIGYSVFGVIDDHPLGSARYFLSKRF